MIKKYVFLGRKKTFWFLLSLFLIAPGIAALIWWKLPLGIDFRGGAQFELSFEKPTNEESLRAKIESYKLVEGTQITSTDSGSYLIRVLPIDNPKYQDLIKQLEKDFGKVTEKQFQLVQPSVSADLTRKAIIAVILASLLIVIYLAISFRGVNKPLSSWQFGSIAVIALLHDVLFTVGTFAILAHFLPFEVDASFITALLTVMGFSVHDTIVVFDRIRENIITHKLDKFHDFERIVDISLAQTFNRSIATSLTVIFTLASLTLIGGSSIRAFLMTLLIGITIGTYSSIFTASPLLVVWQNRKTRQLASTS